MGKKFHAWPTKWEYDHQVFRVHSIFSGTPPVMRVKVNLSFDDMRAVRKLADERGVKIAELAAQLLRNAVASSGTPARSPRYRCAKCKSTNVEGTLPGWFKVNCDGEPVEIDNDADYLYGYCPDCETSGYFDEVVEQIDQNEETGE